MLKATHFPACYVEISEGASLGVSPGAKKRAPFYLAAEEWIARNLPADSYLFTWQLGRTVVMGRNQVAHQEVNLDFCREHHIDVIRRKSGGGAIYADEGNIMISLVTPHARVEDLFREYAETVAGALRRLGAEAEVHGRNDVVLMGRGKVCGNAFYHMGERDVIHGTMLYDTDPDLLQGALHSNPQKLSAKGVQSVRARIGVLKGMLRAPEGLSEQQEVGWLREELRGMLTDRCIVLKESDVREIEQLEQTYYAYDFLYGSSARDEEVRQARVEGCGSVEVHFRLKGSIVREVSVTGDFFELADTQKAFQEAFEGVMFTQENLVEAIRRSHPERAVRMLTEEQLISLITNT